MIAQRVGLLEFFLGFLPVPFLKEQKAEIIVGLRQIGLQRERLLKLTVWLRRGSLLWPSGLRRYYMQKPNPD